MLFFTLLTLVESDRADGDVEREEQIVGPL